MKMVEFGNCVDTDEAAENEPPHLDLQCLPLVFEFSVQFSLNKHF